MICWFVISFDVFWGEVEKPPVTVPTWCAKVLDTLLMGFKPIACSKLLAEKRRLNVPYSDATENAQRMCQVLYTARIGVNRLLGTLLDAPVDNCMLPEQTAQHRSAR
jgi:hypothetical protein